MNFHRNSTCNDTFFAPNQPQTAAQKASFQAATCRVLQCGRHPTANRKGFARATTFLFRQKTRTRSGWQNGGRLRISPYIPAHPQHHAMPSMHARRSHDAAKTAVCELDLAKNIVFKSYFDQKHVFFQKATLFFPIKVLACRKNSYFCTQIH